MAFQVPHSYLGISFLVMLGAIRQKMMVLHKGFAGEGGWEFELLLLVGAIALYLGAGKFALDRVLLGI